jgi:outer membrane protein with beta-barrel domain
MRLARILVLASAILAAIPGTAWSQGFVTPYIGYNYGGDSINCIGLRNCEEKHKNFGVSLGKTNGIFGIEQDIAYAPHFFGERAEGGNSMLTVMSSLLVVAPLGPIQPYGLFGIGLMRPHTLAGAKNAFGYDIGAGMNILFGSHVGVRGDLRRMRSMQNVTLFIFSGEKLEFWRASLGLTLR